jgi:molybdenum-dependent DNA-binding transcriptional regulator ModE
MSKINESRTEKMRVKSMEELKAIIESGSLSSAAAEYEMNRRMAKGNK